MDNRSEFVAPLSIEVRRWGENYIMHVTGATAIANTVAYISDLLDPIAMFLGSPGRDRFASSYSVRVRQRCWCT